MVHSVYCAQAYGTLYSILVLIWFPYCNKAYQDLDKTKQSFSGSFPSNSTPSLLEMWKNFWMAWMLIFWISVIDYLGTDETFVDKYCTLDDKENSTKELSIMEVYPHSCKVCIRKDGNSYM